MNVAIITARAGSKSIENKNVFPVGGLPLIAFPIQAALDAEWVDKVYISTDGKEIGAVGEAMGCEIIWRPDELGGDHVNHGDVIKHAVEYVDAHIEALENVVLLLGNTVMIDGDLIDQCLAVMDAEPSLDSAMTVWEAADDHPYRALEIKEGLVKSWEGKPRNISTERQSYPRIYYYDQGVWAFRKECVQRREGPDPWWWMGRRCKPIVRTWTTGRDVHTHFDRLIAEHYIENRAMYRAEETRIVPKTERGAST